MSVSTVAIDAFSQAEWPRVCAIYLEGILSGNATFETEPPSWDQWDRNHLAVGRRVARTEEGVVGWAALSPVSPRKCYAGVAEVSVYVAESARKQGIGRALLRQIIADSEAHGLWTLQGVVFPENVASLRMCTANGFRQVGRRKHVAKLDGVWRDTVLIERRSQRVGIG
jgi:L-amino acid N-acyltransferase YncA